MIIDYEKLQFSAEKLLEIFERNKISTVSDLEQVLDEKFIVDTHPSDFVMVELRPSNKGTFACTVSYIAPSYGIPIELKINSELNYSQIFIKTKDMVDGYILFEYGAIDEFQNLRQYKRLETTDLTELIKEIKKLIS